MNDTFAQTPSVSPAATLCYEARALRRSGHDPADVQRCLDKAQRVAQQAYGSEPPCTYPHELADALLWLMRVEPVHKVRRQLGERAAQLYKRDRQTLAYITRLAQCNLCVTRLMPWHAYM